MELSNLEKSFSAQNKTKYPMAINQFLDKERQIIFMDDVKFLVVYIDFTYSGWGILFSTLPTIMLQGFIVQSL